MAIGNCVCLLCLSGIGSFCFLFSGTKFKSRGERSQVVPCSERGGKSTAVKGIQERERNEKIPPNDY